MHRVDGVDEGNVCQHAVSQTTGQGQRGDIFNGNFIEDRRPNYVTSHEGGGGDTGFGPVLLVSSNLVSTVPAQPAEDAEQESQGTRPHTTVKSEESAHLQRPWHSLRRRGSVTTYSDEGGSSRIGGNSSDSCDERVKKRILRSPWMVRERLQTEDASVDASSVVFHGKEEGLKVELTVSAPLLSVT